MGLAGVREAEPGQTLQVQICLVVRCFKGKSCPELHGEKLKMRAATPAPFLQFQKRGIWVPFRRFDAIHVNRAPNASCHAVVKEGSFFGAGSHRRNELVEVEDNIPTPGTRELGPLQSKMGRQPRSGDFSLAIGPLDPETDRR
jgi:hypothetical protein